MTIRPFRIADAPALAAMFHAAVHALAARDYTPAQIRAWSPAPADPARWVARAADGRTTLVAVDAHGRPVAYADLERDGHLDHLSRHPDHPGSAAPLYAAIEDTARSQGITHLHVDASEPARRFLGRRGFVMVARRDFAIDEVPIHNWAMTKTLSPK